MKRRFTYVLLWRFSLPLSVVMTGTPAGDRAAPTANRRPIFPLPRNAPVHKGQPSCAGRASPAGPEGQPPVPGVMQLPSGPVMPPNMPPQAMQPGDVAVPQPGGPEAAADAMAAAAAQAAGAGPPSTQPAGPWSASRPMPEKYRVLMTGATSSSAAGACGPKGPSPGGAMEAAFAFRCAGREDGELHRVHRGDRQGRHQAVPQGRPRGRRQGRGHFAELDGVRIERQNDEGRGRLQPRRAPVPPPPPQPPRPVNPDNPDSRDRTGQAARTVQRPARSAGQNAAGRGDRPGRPSRWPIPAGAQINAEGPQPPQPPQ